MSVSGWIGLAGALLLLMALSSAYLKRLPVTAAVIYLGVGIAVSPTGFDLLDIDFIRQSAVLEHLTEIAVIISLFMGGLKMRLPLRHPAWSPALRLAGPVMLVSIAGVALFAHGVFGLAWPAAVLLGAILAPTDPVLAGMVTVNDASDEDPVRYGLSGEAGFNDGAAFPFVIFALMWMGNPDVGAWAGGWALHRLVWAVPAGIGIGWVMGKAVGWLAIRLRSRHQETEAPNDLLALALIALSYTVAEAAGSWGFLAAFTAGIGFRRAEIKTVEKHPVLEPDQIEEPHETMLTAHPPAEETVGSGVEEEELTHPSKAAGVVIGEIITFGGTAERLLEAMMVMLVGICLSAHWDWRGAALAAVLFILIRPLGSLILLAGTPASMPQRALMGWFGIRGIGSLYYLCYSFNHGLNFRQKEMAGITITVVALSIVIHGVSGQPVLDWYRRTPRKEAGGS
ncbi:MAG: sodium:proton antiporter [Verrucomicrobiaceae bacterium]|nr:MAG: sodium:proton antiporter [Verrucomicrobiaceae bacterium]